MSRQVIFINSHPIQYFAPLYKYLNDHGQAVEVWYCSDENVKGHFDRQFNSMVTWDVPILEGYPHRFFKNRSWKRSLYGGFFGLFNPSMLVAIVKQKKSVIVVHGWGYLTHVLMIVVARMAGHIVCLRGETPLNQELRKSKLVRFVKRIFLRGFLFKFVNYFLYIGTQNRNFYKYHGISDRRIVSVPYAVDNLRFREAASQLIPKKEDLRKELGIPSQAKVVLFSGKLIEKKRPMDLIRAYQNLSVVDKALLMVGDGILKTELERYIADEKIANVFLAGFINQSDIVKYYAVADVFVMCSGVGETWGLSVNEAMNFDLPLVVSDTTGCSSDLVQPGANGYIFPEGDIREFTQAIEKALVLHGGTGRSIIEKHSFKTIFNAFQSEIDVKTVQIEH